MGGKTSTSTSQVQIPQDVLDRYNAVNANAAQVAQTPFQQYSTNPNAFVAPVTPTQEAGIANTNAASGMAQPYFNAATGFALAGAQPVNASPLDASAINQYMNPYLNTVLGATSAQINQNNQQQMAGQLGNAIQQGAFGGDRSGIAAAVLAGQQQLAAGQTYSGIASDAYQQALAAAQQQQGVNLGAAQANRAALQGTSSTLAGLGSGAQQAALTGAQAQLGAGQVEQQTAQAGLTALYNQFLQQQSYPFQTAQFLANIAEGTGALSGSTTTTTQPGGLFSDDRLKEDIVPVGKTFEGQNIIRFRYRGDPTVRIGLSAQETERFHPEAVIQHPSGFKMVDYGRATANSAGFALAANDDWFEPEERRARAAGGRIARQEGGGMSAWGLYPAGVNPMSISELLQAQAQMYGPGFGGAGLYGGSAGGIPHGGQGYVPQANLPVPMMRIAEPAQRQQPDPLGTAAKAAEAVTGWEKAAPDIVKGAKWIGSHMPQGQKSPQILTDEQPIQSEQFQPAVTPSIDQSDVQANPTFTDDGGGDVPDISADVPDFGAARGGFMRARRQDGGDINPYGASGGLNIPGGYGGAPHQLQSAKTPSQGPSGLTTALGDAANMATVGEGIAKAAPEIGKGIGWLSSLASGIPFADGGFVNNLPQPWKAEVGALENMPLPRALGLARGGRLARQDGGPADPYHPDGPGLNIPDDSQQHPQLAVATPPKQQDSSSQTMGDIMDVAKLAMMFAGAKRGGRIGFADGGMPDFDQDLADAALHQSEAATGPDPGPSAPPAAEGAPGGFGGAAAAAGALAQHAGAAAEAAAHGRQPGGFAGMMARIAQLEGSGHNPVSSAQGQYQITDPTFTGLFRQMFPDRAASMSKGDILALRGTPEGAQLSAEMGPQLAHNNMATLQAHGYEPSAPNVYLAHLLGPGGAMRVLGADPSTPLTKLLHADAISENPTIMRGKSAGDLRGWAASRMQYARGGRVGFAAGGFARVGRQGGGELSPDDPRLNQANYEDAEPNQTPEEMAQQDFSPADAAVHSSSGANAVPGKEELAAEMAERTGQPQGFQGAVQGAEQGIGKFAKSAWDWAKVPEHFIPLITGIAGALAAPTKYPLVALSQGALAGANAYQAQRQFGLSQQATAQKWQEVGAYSLEARTRALSTMLANFQQQYHQLPPKTLNGPVTYRDNYGNEISADEYGRRRDAIINSFHLAGGDSATGQGGVTAPSAGVSTAGGASAPTGQPTDASTAYPPSSLLAGPPPPPPGPPSQQSSSPSGGPTGVGGGLQHPASLSPTASLHDRVAGGAYTGGPKIPPLDTSNLDDDNNSTALRALGNYQISQGFSAAGNANLKKADDLEAGAVVKDKSGNDYYGYVNRAAAIKNAAQQQADGQKTIDARNAEASQFFDPNGEYAQSGALLNSLIPLYQNWDTEGGLRQSWAKLVSNARGTPWESTFSDADKQVQAAIQTGDKDAMRLAMSGAAGSLGADILHRAAATGLAASQEALPDPKLGPATRYEIVGMLGGALGMKRQQLQDWRNTKGAGPGGTDGVDAAHIADYDTDWGGQNKVGDYNQRAFDKIPYFQGMTLQDKEAHPRHPTSVADVQNWPKATAQNPNLGVPFIIPSGKYKGRMAITDARTPAGFSLVK